MDSRAAGPTIRSVRARGSEVPWAQGEKEVKARVRIQGALAGQYETRIAAINKSLREQEREEEERRKLIKAKERQKIVEKVDKYRCDLLRHEVTLLEEKKTRQEQERLAAL